MWPRKRAGSADHLSNYWNALVAGAPLSEVAELAVPVEPDIREMVNRVRAARLQAGPDPAIVARIEREMLQALAGGSSAVTPPAVKPIPAEVGAPTPRHVVDVRARREIISVRLAQAGSIALLIGTLAFGYFALQPEFRDAKEPTTETPVASPAATPDGTPVSTRPAGKGINIVGADGTGLVALGDDVDGADPVWSPDGSRVAFTSEDGIYVMNADGSGRTLIVETPRDLSAMALGGPGANGNPGRLPSWSPDGSKIAYATRQGAIYVVDSDGKNLTKLADPGERTTTGESFESETGYDWRPAWSPDSDSLAIVSGYGPEREILLVSGLIDREPEVTPLVDLPGDITGPAWSRDGTLAFLVTSADESNGVYLIRPGGDEPRRLADVAPVSESPPTWAPDGSGLLFVAFDGVWSVNVDGSGLTKVAGVPRGAQSVALSPDGTKLAFVAEGFPYVVNLDGSGLRRLANIQTEWTNLVWSPDGKSLMFGS